MKYRRSSTRRDRSTEPHSRIPDAIYFDVLPFLNGNEVKLWLALKSREWRKDGTRRGLVKKSLNRIAADIKMNRSSLQRAFRGLKKKALVEWAGFGIRLLEPNFTTAVTTGFTTETFRRRRPLDEPGVAQIAASTGRLLRPGTTVIPFRGNESGCGRSDLTIRRARDEPARAVDTRNDFDHHASRGSARASAQGSGALLENAHSKRKDSAEMREENNSRDELDVRPLDRETMHELLKKIRARAEAAADEGAAKRDADKALEWKKDADRRAELRRQAEELLAAERKTEP